MISLSDSNFSENLPVGSIIGTFSAIDPDINATLTYSLKDASSTYSYNLFMLEENGTLHTAAEFDYETMYQPSISQSLQPINMEHLRKEISHSLFWM